MPTARGPLPPGWNRKKVRVTAPVHEPPSRERRSPHAGRESAYECTVPSLWVGKPFSWHYAHEKPYEAVFPDCWAHSFGGSGPYNHRDCCQTRHKDSSGAREYCISQREDLSFQPADCVSIPDTFQGDARWESDSSTEEGRDRRFSRNHRGSGAELDKCNCRPDSEQRVRNRPPTPRPDCPEREDQPVVQKGKKGPKGGVVARPAKDSAGGVAGRPAKESARGERPSRDSKTRVRKAKAAAKKIAVGAANAYPWLQEPAPPAEEAPVPRLGRGAFGARRQGGNAPPAAERGGHRYAPPPVASTRRRTVQPLGELRRPQITVLQRPSTDYRLPAVGDASAIGSVEDQQAFNRINQEQLELEETGNDPAQRRVGELPPCWPCHLNPVEQRVAVRRYIRWFKERDLPVPGGRRHYATASELEAARRQLSDWLPTPGGEEAPPRVPDPSPNRFPAEYRAPFDPPADSEESDWEL